jgi:hypothetical protein
MRTRTSISSDKKVFSRSIQDKLSLKSPSEIVKRIVQKEFFFSQRREDTKTFLFTRSKFQDRLLKNLASLAALRKIASFQSCLITIHACLHGV